MTKINSLSQLNKKSNIQYKSRNMSFDYVDDCKTQLNTNDELYQIWSYSTIVGYYNKTTHYAVFTNRKYSPTTSKQITQLCRENQLNHDFVDMTFSNFSTYSDLEKLFELLA